MPMVRANRLDGRCVLTGALLVLSVLFLCCDVNGDDWFMIDHGRDIIENGFYRSTDFLSIHDWLPFMHQKWAMCLLVYGAYSWAGVWGMRALMIVLIMGLVLALYMLVNRLYPDGRWHNSVYIFAFIVLGCHRYLISLRPHIFSAGMIAVELYVLERYTRGYIKHGRLYGTLFIASLVTMWLHSTMWYACLIPVLPYLCENRFVSRYVRFIDGDAGMPVRVRAACVAALLAGGVLNPEGVGIFRYLAVTVTAGSGADYPWIGELRPMPVLLYYNELGIMGWMWLGGLAAPCVMALIRGRIRQRDAYLLAGSVLMPMVSFRLLFYSYVILVFVAASLGHDAGDKDNTIRDAAGLIGLSVCGMLLLFGFARNYGAYVDYDMRHAAISSIVDFIKSDSDDASVLFLDPSMASYAEHLGVRCFLDCRAELFSASDVNGHSPAGDISDLIYGTWRGNALDISGVQEFVDYYGLDYFVVYDRNGPYGTEYINMLVEIGERVPDLDGGYALYRL